MKIEFSYIEKFLIYYIVVSIILCSGSIFGYMHLSFLWTTQLFCAVILLLMRKESGVEKNELIYGSFLILISFLNWLLLSDTSLNNEVAFIMNLLTLFLLASSISHEEYRNAYINSMSVIAATSLFEYILSQFGIFFGQNTVYASGNYYIVSRTFHVYRAWTLNYNSANIRNAGIFWEPGAYQLFLALALFFLLNCKTRKFKRTLIILLAVSIITTQSTTGYLVLILMLAYYMMLNNQLTWKNICYLSIFTCVVITIFCTDNVITEKLTYSNDSFSKRLVDNWATLQAVLQKPLLGHGYNSSSLTSYLESMGAVNSSTGLLLFAAMFGIPITLLVFIRMCFGLRAFAIRKDSRTFWIVAVFWLIIFLTEHFMVKEVCLIFYFQFSKGITEMNRDYMEREESL